MRFSERWRIWSAWFLGVAVRMSASSMWWMPIAYGGRHHRNRPSRPPPPRTPGFPRCAPFLPESCLLVGPLRDMFPRRPGTAAATADHRRRRSGVNPAPQADDGGAPAVVRLRFGEVLYS